MAKSSLRLAGQGEPGIATRQALQERAGLDAAHLVQQAYGTQTAALFGVPGRVEAFQQGLDVAPNLRRGLGGQRPVKGRSGRFDPTGQFGARPLARGEVFTVQVGDELTNTLRRQSQGRAQPFATAR